LVATCLAIAGCGTATGSGSGQQLSQCPSGPPAQARPCDERALFGLVRNAHDPNTVLPQITAQAYAAGGFLAANCHVLMHEVGRRYAALHHVTLATLMNYLPRSNDPGCSAGFAHGLIMHIAPAVMRAGPQVAAAVCRRPQTRFQRYSCVHGLGHAYMRAMYEALQPALRLCRALGPRDAADCAQGAFHDYWLSIAGTDRAPRPASAVTDPRKLCGPLKGQFVLACWYRAFIDTRPYGYQTKSAADLLRICRGTTGLQRSGCVTAASVIGSPNPLVGMRVCAALPRRDIVACVHGVKVENLLANDVVDQRRVIARCGWFAGEVRHGCFTWLGKTLAVITNGWFGRIGCPRLQHPADRAACRAGARRMNDALVTFS